MKHGIWGSCDSPILLQYQYEPLIAGNAVRILNLDPANDFQSPLRGTITQEQPEIGSFVLDPDSCAYSAISYTWGGQMTTHRLLLGLDALWTSLPITQNADSLLRHLRDDQKNTRLWIDGVCLNQSDQGEKDQQIPLMGQIYAHAKRVHIWLGDDEIEDARQAFSLIRALEVKGGEMLHPGTKEFLCLERFFNRSWFTRRWVIQEVFFAHNAYFHCGDHTLSLSRVMSVLAKASGIGWSELPGWGSRMLTSSIGIGQTHRQRLLSLLWDFHESECSDKRDRIAAVYSLSDSHGRAPLRYDIGNWKQMYKQISSYYLNDDSETAHAILLHLCDFGSIKSTTDNEIPSWVPNWSTKREALVPFKGLESFVDYPVLDNPAETPGSWFNMTSWWRMSDKKRWKRALAQSQWKAGLDSDGKPTPMQLEVSGNTLRISYGFLTFIYGCGIVDQVVCPGLSAAFWEEVVKLVRWQEKRLDRVKDHFKVDSVVHQARRRHKMEVDSLSSLLVGVLAGKYPASAYAFPDLRKAIKRLCADLRLGRNRGNNLQALTDDQKILLGRIRSAMENMALLRVQATVGYYWAIGPLNLLRGDWLIPTIAQGEQVPHRPEPRITRFMSLRTAGPENQGDVWYPTPASDPEGRLRRLLWFKMAKFEPVHITAKFVGCGGSCLHSFDYNVSHDEVMWRVLRQATQAADRRLRRRLPILFDII